MNAALRSEAELQPSLAATISAPELEGSETPLRAEVRVVVPLRSDERARLQAILQRIAGRPVEMDVQQDPSILGGAWVRMGDLVIDGTVKGRLQALEEQLCAECRLLLAENSTPEEAGR